MSQQTHPPRWAAALLQWLVDDALHTPRGDFEEYFHEIARERGVPRARWWYRAQVVRMVPGRLVAKLIWNLLMLKNHLLLAYRNLRKNKVAAAINIFGLSFAIGCTLVAYLYVQSMINNEASHENGDTIFLVQQQVREQGEQKEVGYTPIPMGPALAAEFPQVVGAVRLKNGGGTVVQDGNEFHESIRFVDPGFLQMFTFPLQYGDPQQALTQPNTVVLSEGAATKYFGEENPLGQTLLLKLAEAEAVPFTVTGVAAAYNPRTSLWFSLLLPFEHRPSPSDTDWSETTTATFIQVSSPRSLADVSTQMAPYVQLQNEAAGEEGPVVEQFTFGNLYELARHSDEVESTIAGHIPWAPVITLSVMALFLLVLSCVNYMNIALAAATRRLKEIGIRKVVGSNRGQLVVQFLTENVVLCVFALGVGFGVAYLFLVPAFTDIAGGAVNLWDTPLVALAVFLGCLLVGVGLFSGAYPALYISSFQPISILSNTQKLGRRNVFMQSLLTVQFVLAFITMIVCLGLVFNAQDEQSRDWGYNQAHTLVMQLPNPATYEVMRNEVAQLPNITAVSGAQEHIGRSHTWIEPVIAGESMWARTFGVDAAYLETLGLRLKEGRFFDAEQVSIAADEVVINETFAQRQGWTEPLGQTLRIDSTTYAVIGVMEDFHYDGFTDDIAPVVFQLADAASHTFLALRVEAGAGTQTAEAVAAIGARLMPDETDWYFFQDTVFDGYFQETQGITDIFLFIAVLALLISCMGLFGLASQNTASRLKEVSIRKVLGATVTHVAALMNRRYALLLLLAAVLATPLSYLLLNALLDSIYVYRMGIGVGPFLLAYLLVFLTGLLTISTQLRLLAIANPADLLRNE